MRRSLALLGLAIGLFALILQFSITIPASLDAGRSLPLSLVFYFSFFTILTNIGAVLVYAASLWGRPAIFIHPRARASVAAAITLVGTFYHIVLAPLWRPEGLFLVCDVLLHYVAPIVFVVWFIAFNRSGTLTPRDVPAMLMLPQAYLIYVMIRGAILGEYPYPVFAANELGYAQVAINILGLLVIFAALNAIAVAIDRFRPVPQAK
jgi:hypothetical protein